MDVKFGETFSVTDEMVSGFNDKGYLIIRNLFSSEEVAAIAKNIEEGDQFQKFSFSVLDRHGNKSSQITWNSPGNDVIGMAARCQKVVETCSKLLGGEVYHYHSKMVIKAPQSGGERTWHQDYGYWYNNGCLFPDMITLFVPMVKTDRSNGCLQILEGSHKAGRLEHTFSGNEQGADRERVEHIKSVCPLKYLEMEAGDSLFFHCNLLHMSDVNTSDGTRVAFLPAYNMARNNPAWKHHHASYTPIDVVPDSDILACTNFKDTSGKDFLDMGNTKSLENQVKNVTTS